MKKTTKRGLTLKTESIRTLSAANLEVARGGVVGDADACSYPFRPRTCSTYSEETHCSGLP